MLVYCPNCKRVWLLPSSASYGRCKACNTTAISVFNINIIKGSEEMLDYEDMILARQEMIEIWEDDPDSAACEIGKCWWDDLPDEEFTEVFI